MARTFEDYLGKAIDAANDGFLSEAARKRALADVNRAWDVLKNEIHERILSEADGKFVPAGETLNDEEWAARRNWINAQGYWDLPDYPHTYRAEKHAAFFGDLNAKALEAIQLRDAIKTVDIAAPVKDEGKASIVAVRKTIVEEMERRKAQYVEALEIGRHFGGLPVSVNAHWVHGHKGAVFLRHFFYLAGKLTPLNTIIAAADTLEREKEGRA
ncbi:MAG: hypothetical protein E6R03_03210 [Hyphomicrobiaceae bacterium]|nr:MAG: hypothetical protein E6R03_03210 [Hyphomicrobiaceae bacterium]